MYWGIDWGPYPYNLPAKKLYDAGLRFFITKGACNATVGLLQQFREAGFVVGTYYWNDPIISPALQVQTFTNAIQKEQPDFISLDIEQYWKSWAEWNAWINTGTPMTQYFTPAEISNNAKAVRDGLKSAFPDKFYLNYTAKWFTAGWMTDKVTYQFKAPWLFEDPCWYASAFDYGQQWYDIQYADILKTPGDAKPDIPVGAPGWKMWQYSSRMCVPDLQFPFDWNVFDGTLEELKGQEVIGMPAGIYNQEVKISDRAHLVFISDEDKQINVQGICAGADALGMYMVNQATGTMQVHKDTGFQTWADRATVPVMGVIGLDQNLFWNKEINLDVFTNTKYRNMWNNETIEAIVRQWHVTSLPDNAWDKDRLKISASDGWHPIMGIILHMQTDTAKGSPINGLWQQAIVDDLLNPLTTLMQGGYIPDVPIYVMASWEWWKKYAGDDGWKIKDRMTSGMVKGLGMMRIWGQEEVGLPTEKSPQATPYQTVGEFWTNVPAPSYRYPFDAGVNMDFFVYTYNRLRAVDMFYAGATVTPATCGIWSDTKDEMYKALNWQPAQPPVNPPVDPPPSDLVARVKALEDQVRADGILLNELVTWAQGVKLTQFQGPG